MCILFQVLKTGLYQPETMGDPIIPCLSGDQWSCMAVKPVLQLFFFFSCGLTLRSIINPGCFPTNLPENESLRKNCWNYNIFPQQLKLMGSSAQISSGVCRCGSQEQVPQEGSGRFRRVPACAGVGSGGGFRKVPESSGVPEAGSGRFRMVAAYAGVGSGGRLRKVPESSAVKWCRFGKQVPGRFRRFLA